jgi:hypothetical protein
MEGAAAYAVVKALLPVRLAISILLMPWFARVFVIPVTSRLSRLFRRSKKQDKNKAANALENELAEEVKIKKPDDTQNPQRPRL